MDADADSDQTLTPLVATAYLINTQIIRRNISITLEDTWIRNMNISFLIERQINFV